MFKHIKINKEDDIKLIWLSNNDNTSYVFFAYPIHVLLTTSDVSFFNVTFWFDGNEFMDGSFRTNPADSINEQTRYALLCCETILRDICDANQWQTITRSFFLHCSSVHPPDKDKLLEYERIKMNLYRDVFQYISNINYDDLDTD